MCMCLCVGVFAVEEWMPIRKQISSSVSWKSVCVLDRECCEVKESTVTMVCNSIVM